MRGDNVQWVPVGQLGEVRMGKQLSPSSRTGANQLPYLRVANVFEGRISYEDVKLMGFSPGEQQVYQLQPGDILLNEGQESLSMVGRSAIYRGEPGAHCFQNTLIRFRPGQKLLPEYAQAVFIFWRRTNVFANTAEKTSISHLGGSRFAKLKFPLIPLEKQQRIVDVLSAASEAERATEASIAKLRTVREAFIESLLTRPSGKTAESSNWSEAPLRTRLARIDTGKSPDLPDAPAGPGEWGVLKVSAIKSEGFNPRENKAVTSESLINERYRVRPGDLLMSRANTPELVGSSCLAKPSAEKVMLSDKTLRLVVDTNIADPRFVNLCLGSTRIRRQIELASSGSSRSMQNISQLAVGNLSVLWPPRQHQQRIVEVLDARDKQIQQEESRLAKLRTLRQGLADDLLSGKVRVGEAA